jgi:ligand-binding sensor domain-containing protein
VRACWLFVLFGFAGSIAIGGVGEWKTYTSKRQVQAISADHKDPTLLWVATSGGLFSYRYTDNTFREYTTSEGLRTIDLTAITTDIHGVVWIGAANGLIHRYYPTTGEWQYITQITEDKDHGTSKRINSLRTVGDSLYILSDIGVSIFSVSSLSFKENYLHQSVAKAKSVEFFDGKIWIGTENGIACTPDSNPNPSAPEGWQVYSSAQGLPSDIITQLGIYNGNLTASTLKGLAYFNGTLWSTYSGTLNKNIIGFNVLNDTSLYFITTSPNQLWNVLNNGNLILSAQFTYSLSSIFSPTLLGTESVGLLLNFDSTWSTIAPPGPPSTKFIGIAVDQKGVIWSGTGKSSGEGFVSFDGKRWRIYNKLQYPEFQYDEFIKVSISKDNSKWISNWGGGVVLVDDEGNVRKTFNTTNGIPPCILDDLSYAVVTGVAADRNGVTWITSRTPPGDTILTQFSSDSSVHYLTGCIISNCQVRNPLNYFTDVVIDNNGTKWFANYTRFEPLPTIGLFYYNENIALPGTLNGWGKITSSADQSVDRVYCIAVGQEGDVWLGTGQGITIIFDPLDPVQKIASYHPLRDQVIQSIVVDALDNKWVATQQNGVFVLSPDGTSILKKYTIENTNGQLLDDDVNSIAINHNTGIIYFGTEKGLSSLTTPAITPVQTLGNINVTPNPFYLPSSSNLIVDGLVRSSSMKILTVSGKPVKEIQTPGGKIGFWDGRNEKGDLVSTGVYFVVVFAENGEQVAVGKVAVIRK